jgi:hypothetical protein
VKIEKHQMQDWKEASGDLRSAHDLALPRATETQIQTVLADDDRSAGDVNV